LIGNSWETVIQNAEKNNAEERVNVMECSQPGLIRDEELIAYLEGEPVRPAVVRHVARCQHCAEQVAGYRRMQQALKSKLYRWNCPPNQLLGEYQLGLLDEQETLQVQSHLSICHLCAAEVASLANFLATDFVVVTPSVSRNHHSVQSIRQTLDTWVGQEIRKIAATLVQPKQQHRLRDAAVPVSSWPRRYGADDVTITLQVEPDQKDGLRLIGFVIRQEQPLEALQDIPVFLLAEGDILYTQVIDDLGNFVFTGLPPATYTLEVRFPSATIVIGQLQIQL
jgi:hypothetical protein